MFFHIYISECRKDVFKTSRQNAQVAFLMGNSWYDII